MTNAHFWTADLLEIRADLLVMDNLCAQFGCKRRSSSISKTVVQRLISPSGPEARPEDDMDALLLLHRREKTSTLDDYCDGVSPNY